MSATNWTAETDSATVAKRAGGRRRYNAVRTAQAAMRKRQENLLLAQEVRFMTWGWQSELARRLGVHRSTICRDCSEFLEAKRLGISMEQVVELRRLRKSTDKRMWRGMPW